MIGFLSRLKLQIIAGLAVFAASLGTIFMAIRSGRRDAINKAKIKDQERADKIRDRVERNADDRVRKYDDAGWRE